MLRFREMIGFFQVRYVALGLAIALALYLAMIPVRLREVRSRVPVPQAIFVLGGGRDREVAAARLAVQHPELEVWVSSGSEAEVVTGIFRRMGVASERLHLDYRASDTVTNFTTMAEFFRRRKIEHVFLVTSAFHMRRARAISFFVFGSRGIVCTPSGVNSGRQVELILQIIRDIGRAILWLATGATGASFGTKWLNHCYRPKI